MNVTVITGASDVIGAEHQCRSLTARGKLARFVKLIAPGRVEDMALAALKDDVRPK